ncbi:amidohydrolase family protein [Pseudidiomarina terrestris]|uniref:Amidohydrolase family protein n=1 Tax=Pseudidiomarina terrestris TaxID=2820060 RepID=A0AAW7R3H7_9GAMM|nr:MULTISPECIES: amidohydrolase family protein [unclassified Pseudidiomarina]MDN7125215.1 amidohydrolase family protein [Pseudidiomarina sp. 1APP75-32.1]MDN7127384.1 amidohydrolase family protein [Pseudidiomarina sp. 1APR75-33.1]MDN7129974.1 amidohydrolase family protein [Pseudidiomarina sp. 1APR75-15]MDN7136126.1 amidohydrolase family protein [Pseudidiomarina sp. 1ASP75-5]MDN7138348.1 amidohydrolase family protein [Pseudidiomarina sp. 1ASP75-14]
MTESDKKIADNPQPGRIIDAHLHIYNDAYPLIENQGFLPPPFSVEDYQHRTRDLPIVGGVVVSGSSHGFDQKYLKPALEKLGDQFVGITNLPSTVSDEKILSLRDAGVRGVRVNLKRGVVSGLDNLVDFGMRIWDLAGWHLEMYVDSRELDEIIPKLIKLPKASVDHLGMARSGLSQVRKLAEAGVKIKASGFGRTEVNVAEAVQKLYETNPDCLMFGTDLPSNRAERPFNRTDISVVAGALDNADAIDKVFARNAAEFYNIKL